MNFKLTKIGKVIVPLQKSKKIVKKLLTLQFENVILYEQPQEVVEMIFEN